MRNSTWQPRGANWWHWYVCPRHGARLTTGKQIAPWHWEHICPVDHEVLKGHYDGTVISRTHAQCGTAIRVEACCTRSQARNATRVESENPHGVRGTLPRISSAQQRWESGSRKWKRCRG